MGKVSRRKFLGTVGAATGVAGAAETRQGGKGADRKNRVAPGPNLREDVRDLVDKTRFIDTHEHLWPEAMRINALSKPDPTRRRPRSHCAPWRRASHYRADRRRLVARE